MESDLPTTTPSQYMREFRPELYSDSKKRVGYLLRPEVLSHHLDTITERNQTHDFELFCRKLCERSICPNLRPATGPEGGGDSKADTETAPVSDEISKLSYIGLANGGRERWAFAFSAKQKWSEKVKDDVAGIVATDRGYQRIFFITSRAARAKDRARIEDDLSEKYGIPVTIHDRSWIIAEVIEKDRRDLAFHYLGVGEETNEAVLGPSDYSRRQQLDLIETELADPSAFEGLALQRATEALVAAKLSRELELPRTDVDGRFMRAVRLADDGGTHRQQLAARYEQLWTAFWWFDDVKFVFAGYDAFETKVYETDSAADYTLLSTLAQLLFNATKLGYATAAEAKLVQRVNRLVAKLSHLANDTDRPNNALEAKTSLLTVRVNQAMLAGKPEELSKLWPQFGDLLTAAEGLGEFNAKGVLRLIETFGLIAGPDRGYRDLVDQAAEFVAKRTGESEAALLLLRRADQLGLDQNMEMIRVLGRATRLLIKKENASELAHAQILLAIAYRSAGLLWASRAACTASAATLFVDAEGDGELPASIFPTLTTAAWLALELRYFPELLELIQVARGALSALPFDDASKAAAAEKFENMDLVLACLIANLSTTEVAKLERMPDVLRSLGLHHSHATLLYQLGYEAKLREGGWIPDADSAEDVATFFNRLAGQPPGDEIWRSGIFNEGGPEVFTTSVLGVLVRVSHTTSDTSITVAEGIVGAIEAVFATSYELDAFGHTEHFDVHVEEAELAQAEIVRDLDHMLMTVRWPTGRSPGATSTFADYQRLLLEIATSVFLATCLSSNMKDAATRLFETEAVMERVSLVAFTCNSRQRAFRGVAHLSNWDEHSPKRWEAIDPRPTIVRDTSGRQQEAEDDVSDSEGGRKHSDHRNLTIESVIDVPLWDRARWSGVGYGPLGPDGPPFLGLIFEDRQAAATIFERWRERFGEEDDSEQLYIGIVQDIPERGPFHYGMVITSNFPPKIVPSGLLMRTSRTQTMEPSSDINLRTFLTSFEKNGFYLLMPMVLVSAGTPDLMKEHFLVKRAFHRKPAARVAATDPEMSFLRPRSLDDSNGTGH